MLSWINNLMMILESQALKLYSSAWKIQNIHGFSIEFLHKICQELMKFRNDYTSPLPQMYWSQWAWTSSRASRTLHRPEAPPASSARSRRPGPCRLRIQQTPWRGRTGRKKPRPLSPGRALRGWEGRSRLLGRRPRPGVELHLLGRSRN